MSGRVACLVVPHFPVAALLRAEPELRGTPLVVGVGGNVVAVSGEAERVGARSGLTIAQALIRHADLVVRPLDADALAAARAALAEVARSVSPRVEIAGEDGGEVLLEASGLDRLFGSPAGVASALLRRAERVGFSAGAGIADGRATARIAAAVAARRGEAIVVEPGGDAAWLAPLPLAVLGRACDPAERGTGRQGWDTVVDDLARLGVRRCGELAAMSADEVASRLGRVAARMRAIAAGADRSELRVVFEPQAYVEGTRLEYGVGSLEALLFLIRGLLDRVMARLALASLACSGLTVSLTLDDGGRTDRTIGVLAPTRDAKTLLLLARTALESAPPHAAVEAVQVQALPDRARADQLDLFRPAGPPPEQLATTLARLAALCGNGKVGKPVPPHGWRPDAFRMAPFDPAAASRARTGSAAEAHDAAALLVGSCATLALRALRPARAAQVFVKGGSIVYVRAPGLGGRAVVTSGPWRIDAEWWTSVPCRRDYYDVQLSDGGVYRLYRDLDARNADASWFVDGCYD